MHRWMKVLPLMDHSEALSVTSLAWRPRGHGARPRGPLMVLVHRAMVLVHRALSHPPPLPSGFWYPYRNIFSLCQELGLSPFTDWTRSAQYSPAGLEVQQGRGGEEDREVTVQGSSRKVVRVRVERGGRAGRKQEDG